jgi:hypothetical protein
MRKKWIKLLIACILCIGLISGAVLLAQWVLG